VWSPAEDG